MLRQDAATPSHVGLLVFKQISRYLKKNENEARLILECWRRLKALGMKAEGLEQKSNFEVSLYGLG
jgi:hypothetical protein